MISELRTAGTDRRSSVRPGIDEALGDRSGLVEVDVLGKFEGL